MKKNIKITVKKNKNEKAKSRKNPADARLLLFNNRQIFFLRNLTDSWQSFYELSRKTGFSPEEIELLTLDFIEFQNFNKRKHNIDLEFIKVSDSSNPYKVKISRSGKFILLTENFNNSSKANMTNGKFPEYKLKKDLISHVDNGISYVYDDENIDFDDYFKIIK